MRDFRETPEYSLRCFIRKSVKAAPITRSERDILISLLNFWWHHKDAGRNVFHPGREKLAKRAKVTVKTVARCLKKLRDAGVLVTVSHPRGGWGTATQYRVEIIPLLTLCGYGFPSNDDGELAEISGQNVPHFPAKMSHTRRDKMSHGYNKAENLPGQEDYFHSSRPALKLIAGGQR
ncbi:MAG: hypothetical protein RL268_161 [Pseudomonadota bacterium]|jgi:hypothetical protein